MNGSIQCSAQAFGDDPRPHFAKVCSCLSGPAWPQSVVEGLNATIARRLVPRVEIGTASAGCGTEDDGEWMPCSVMSKRFDGSIVPDRELSTIDPYEQQDVALRRLDTCAKIAGPHQALRILSVWSANAATAFLPMKATSAPMCAVVYAPERGPVWDSRTVVFCPTDPPRCLEGSCECANTAHDRVNVRKSEKDEDAEPECWACVPVEAIAKAETKPKAAVGAKSQREVPVYRPPTSQEHGEPGVKQLTQSEESSVTL